MLYYKIFIEITPVLLSISTFVLSFVVYRLQKRFNNFQKEYIRKEYDYRIEPTLELELYKRTKFNYNEEFYLKLNIIERNNLKSVYQIDKYYNVTKLDILDKDSIYLEKDTFLWLSNRKYVKYTFLLLESYNNTYKLYLLYNREDYQFNDKKVLEISSKDYRLVTGIEMLEFEFSKKWEDENLKRVLIEQYKHIIKNYKEYI